MATEYCPRCGAARIGSFRFCRSCQFDFDSPPDAQPPVVNAPPVVSPAPSPPLAAPPTSFTEQYAGTAFDQPVAPAAKKPWRSLTAITLLLVAGLVIVVVIGQALAGALSGNKTIDSSAVPPSGQIWFRTTYDPTTFALTGQTTSVPAGSSVAMVAALSRAATVGEHLTIDTTIAGTVH